MISKAPLTAIRRLPLFRGLASKLGSLLLLFQRSPLVQMLLPEARLLGGSGLGEAAKWSIKAVVGLGAIDAVAGATEIAQVAPQQGEGEVTAWTGGFLNFVVQVTGTPSVDQVSWTVDGLPPGLTHSDTATPSIHSISGTPTEVGEATVTLTAWEGPNQTGSSFSQEFLIIVQPGIITTHPASVAVASGGGTTLSVVADPNGGATSYRWFQGPSGFGSEITGSAGNKATLSLSNLTTTRSYWVRVTQGDLVQNSNTATVSIATAPTITGHPQPASIPSGGTAALSISTSGTAPAIQWYQGNSGVTTSPVPGATSSVFVTPALTATTSFWARATNAAGFANSNTATVTVTVTADPYQEWRVFHFSSAQLNDPQISGNSADPDGDSMSNEDEYVFGTPPLSRQPSPLQISVNGAGQVSLCFTALSASGPGYAGKTRHYTLESRTDLGSGNWAPVSGFEEIVGGNQSVNYLAPADHPRVFYRLGGGLTP